MSRSPLSWGFRAARLFSVRLLVGVTALQVAVAAALVVTDAVKKKDRVKRFGFPHPGSFDATVGDTATTLYTRGEDLYRDMLAAIRGAHHRILFETYLWKADEVGREFRDALNDAAARGVDVYVIFDWFGNLVVPRSFFHFHPDVHVFRFPPVRLSLLLSPLRAAGLTHRKLLVADSEFAFVGGYNIGSLYATEWRDTHVRLSGPAIFELRHSFAQVWNHLSGRRTPRLSQHNPAPWNPPLRAINNIPTDRVYPIRAAYLDAISRAQTYIHLTTAYFIPDQQILTALIEAARRGVDVQIMIPEESNHVVADWLSRGFYSTLLSENITLLLYRNAMIHAKTASIDGLWSVVGTANIDRLSLGFNYETVLEVLDPAFAANMELIFKADRDNCRRVSRKDWGTRHFAARMAESALTPLRTIL
ncbi:MAG: phosphatidylserine/phosphatidylglycerophosphate/cardiolipin synthase family protein [Terrimesophilobacter sp.]